MRNLTIEELMIKEHELELAQMEAASMFCEIEESDTPVSDELYTAVKQNYEKLHNQLSEIGKFVESLILEKCNEIYI